VYSAPIENKEALH